MITDLFCWYRNTRREGDGFGIAVSQDNYSISYAEVTEQTKATSELLHY